MERKRIPYNADKKYGLRFDKRVILVTGAGQGIGRSLAIMYARRGGKVMVNDFAQEKDHNGELVYLADKVVSKLKKMGLRAAANYDSIEHHEDIINCTIRTFGRIDVLVCNAGCFVEKNLTDTGLEDWKQTMDTNLYYNHNLVNECWNYFRYQSYGRIAVAVGEPLKPKQDSTAYNTSKMALLGFCQSLAAEGKEFGIICNAYAPVALTNMTQHVYSKLPEKVQYNLHPKKIAPLVACITHEQCKETGSLFKVGLSRHYKMEFRDAVRFQLSENNWEEAVIKNKVIPSLQGRVAVVTGSHTGMGKMVYDKLTELGATVVGLKEDENGKIVQLKLHNCNMPEKDTVNLDSNIGSSAMLSGSASNISFSNNNSRKGSTDTESDQSASHSIKSRNSFSSLRSLTSLKSLKSIRTPKSLKVVKTKLTVSKKRACYKVKPPQSYQSSIILNSSGIFSDVDSRRSSTYLTLNEKKSRRSSFDQHSSRSSQLAKYSDFNLKKALSAQMKDTDWDPVSPKFELKRKSKTCLGSVAIDPNPNIQASNKTNAQEAVDDIIFELGKIDIIINCAAAVDLGWHQSCRNHLDLAYSLVQAVWPHFKERQFGRIVNIAPIGIAATETIEMGLVGLSGALAAEGNAYGIRSNVLVGGYDETEDRNQSAVLIACMLSLPNAAYQGLQFEASPTCCFLILPRRSRGLDLSARLVPTWQFAEFIHTKWASLTKFKPRPVYEGFLDDMMANNVALSAIPSIPVNTSNEVSCLRYIRLCQRCTITYNYGSEVADVNSWR